MYVIQIIMLKIENATKKYYWQNLLQYILTFSSLVDVTTGDIKINETSLINKGKKIL